MVCQFGRVNPNYSSHSSAFDIALTDWTNRSQVQSIHTGVLSILVNFKIGVLVKKKTLQEPLLIQVDLNRGIKEGLILL